MSQERQSRISTDAPAAFFAVTFVLAVPFYILNALAYLNVFGGPSMGPVYIALFTLTPMVSASLIALRRGGMEGLKQLLCRVLDNRRIGDYRWYVTIVLLPLLIALLSLGGAILFGAQLPPATLPFAALPVVLPFFFILAAAEEIGWMGHAFEPLQAQHGALPAALVLGVVWAIWHVPFFVFMMPDVIIFSAQVVALVSIRVLIAWAYSNTGKSVFAAILFHAMINALLVTLPDTSTIGALGPAISSGLALSAAITVALLWGPQTLARYRFANWTATLSGNESDSTNG